MKKTLLLCSLLAMAVTNVGCVADASDIELEDENIDSAELLATTTVNDVCPPGGSTGANVTSDITGPSMSHNHDQYSRHQVWPNGGCLSTDRKTLIHDFNVAYNRNYRFGAWASWPEATDAVKCVNSKIEYTLQRQDITGGYINLQTTTRNATWVWDNILTLEGHCEGTIVSRDVTNSPSFEGYTFKYRVNARAVRHDGTDETLTTSGANIP
ncbi:hypothetical protein [Polyangium sorediatum]|uniref:Lipoprotein n=1 Tax=Polyangium sorediatum TaxID=889274 RepID=A0ABT6P9J5_9BACT|nr:hypothetical protein [Polyangium sorediatum]MDI1437251.1 hypothetical protein [Polyangium sorediatum]